MPSTATPANQWIRINILRAAFVLVFPLLLIVEPAYSDLSAFGEFIEPVGALLIIAGVLGRFWAILYIGGRKNKMVMMDGPYSICRHPLYLFSTMATFGLGLILGSVVLALLLGGITFTVLMMTAEKEEAFLISEFGEIYRGYAARTPLIIPHPALFKTPPTIDVSLSHLRVNLSDALVFLAFIPLAEGISYLQDLALLPKIPLY